MYIYFERNVSDLWSDKIVVLEPKIAKKETCIYKGTKNEMWQCQYTKNNTHLL